MGWKENKVKRDLEYAKKNIKRIAFNLNRNTDADIIYYLEKNNLNVNAYLKSLIRKDMSENEQEDIYKATKWSITWFKVF